MKSLAFLFVCFMTLAFSSNVFGQFTINETLDATPPAASPNYTATSGTLSVRLFRTGAGTQSACGTLKPFPGTSGTGPYFYDAYTYTPATSGCVTVTFTTTANYFVSTYAGAFNPANLSQNYLADLGASSGAGGTSTYSFNVTAGQPYTIVVNETVVGSPATAYTLQVSAPVGATASGVTVSGQVLTPKSGARSASVVKMTDQNGITRTARTNAKGFYTFEEVPAGETYIFNVNSKLYQYNPQVITISENLDGLNFAPNQ